MSTTLEFPPRTAAPSSPMPDFIGPIRHFPSPGLSGSPKVIKAIVGVMKRVKEVAKGGWNKEGKYAFISVGDLWAVLQDAMAAEGLALSQREVDRRIINKILAVKYEFDAYHVDGEVIYNIGSHTGSCRFEFKSGATDDKAFNKVFVAASKYFALGLFKIPPDDHKAERIHDAGDADDDPPTDRSRNGTPSNAREEPPFDERRNGNGEPSRNERQPRDDRPRNDRPPDGGPPEGWPGNRAPDPPMINRPFDPGMMENANRPPSDPASRGERSSPGTEPDFRSRVMAFKRMLNAAQSEDDAMLIWKDHADLLRQMADDTYDFLRTEYLTRWGIYPPSI